MPETRNNSTTITSPAGRTVRVHLTDRPDGTVHVHVVAALGDEVGAEYPQPARPADFMPPLWCQPITNAQQAEDLLRSLIDLRLAYHPEDDAASVVAPGGRPLFTADQAAALNCRMSEAKSIPDFDATQWLLDNE